MSPERVDPDGDPSPEAQLRDRVAGQLGELLTGPLAGNGSRVAALLATRTRSGRPTAARERAWREFEDRYRARQAHVTREGRAALLTAGAPGAGKSSAVDALGLVDEGWRRLDADVVKDYLVAELAAGGEFSDVLAIELLDGRPVMPRELAGLVHTESLAILERLRSRSLLDAENVVIEGTLTLEPYAHQLLSQLADARYRDVSIIDVEVRREVARAQAVGRWWAGRHSPTEALGGRWVPLEVIDRAYPDPRSARSVCAHTAKALFDSELSGEFELTRLTVVDNTEAGQVTETHERRVGVLQPHARQLSLPEVRGSASAARSAHQSAPRSVTLRPPAAPPKPPPDHPGPKQSPPDLSR